MRVFWKNQSQDDSSHFTLILVILIALVNGLDLFIGNGLIAITLEEGLSDRWIDLVLFPFRVASNWLSLLLFLYFFWLFGSQLEAEVGTSHFGAYVLCGYIFALIGTLFYPLTATYVFFSVFLAVAWRAPDMEILLFFIIPMRLRWVATISLLFLLYSPLQAAYLQKNIFPLLGIFLGLSNFTIFHAKDMLKRIRK